MGINGTSSANADFVGQLYVDVANNIGYIAVQTDTCVTYWK